MEEQDIIDLGRIKAIVIQYKFKLISIITTTTVLALVISFVLPKQYESSVLVRVKSQKQGTGISLQAAAAVALLGGGAVSAPVQGYMELMKSRSVLEPVIEKLDLPPEKKEFLDHKGFAKDYLKFQNAKGTDLVEVTATGRSPEEAQQIASDVITSFQQVLTNLNQSEQSSMMEFLTNRIAVAKKEMEEAEQKFEAFRQKEKIFAPGEQATATMEKVIGFDKRLAELRVQNEANQIKLQDIRNELRKQKLAVIQNYVADNPTILQFRKAIVEKELELVNLRQKYQDKHPNVILLQTEIEEMKKKMREEVGKDVRASTVALTPIHGELMKQEIATDMDLQLGLSIMGVIKAAQADGETEIGQLSGKGRDYAALSRQQTITQEVYTVLIKNYEQTRIQEAMESMDIQIVDEANLPKKPSAPRKLLITAVGGVLGVMLSLAYLFAVSRREARPPYSNSI